MSRPVGRATCGSRWPTSGGWPCRSLKSSVGSGSPSSTLRSCWASLGAPWRRCPSSRRSRRAGRSSCGARAEALEGPTLHPGIQFATAALCAEMVGVAQKVLDMSVEYSKERVQFGRPIGSFQAIKHKCAEMATELEAARAAASYACWAVASGAEDAALSSHIAKSYCSDQLAHLAGEGVQGHGGIAFTWEHDMHLYLKRIKTAQVFLGDGPYHRERIARIVGL